MTQTDLRSRAADAVTSALDPVFFNACCEPVRLQIIRRLIECDAADIGEIAKGFSQDRSVISRHLSILERAGVVLSEKAGRRVVYTLDGPHIVARFETLLQAMQDLVRICCPDPERPQDDT